MNRNMLSIGTIAVLVAFFLAVNVLATTVFKSARVDLTENKLYTLSEGTKNILGSLEEPITLRLFFSKKVLSEDDPENLRRYGMRVQELLEEYRAHSKGKIKLEVLDPEPYSEAEELASSYGIRARPTNQAGEVAYLGLAGTNTTDDEEVIPAFVQARQEFLEYDVTQLVYKLSDPKKPTVGVMTSLPMMGGSFNPMNPMQRPEPAWFLVDQMRQLFEVETVDTSAEEIDPTIDILMLVHPRGLSDETLFAIDQFVLRGGNLLVFVDPYCEAQEVPQNPQNPQAAMMADRSSDLPRLFEKWGIELAANKLAGDDESALQVGWQNQSIDYLVWMRIPHDQMSEDDPVTGQLNQMMIATPGVIDIRADAKTVVTPLITTSDGGGRIDRTKVQFGPDPPGLLKDFFPEGKLNLAVRISGEIETAFPEGKPKAPEPEDEDGQDGEDEEDAEEEEPEAEAWLTKSTTPASVIVVSDADLLQDKWWVQIGNFLGMRMAQPISDNADFAVNALDNLSGSSDLISVRSRGRFNRPFDKKDEIRRAAQDRFQAENDALEEKLRETRRKISELQGEESGSGTVILSAEAVTKLEEFREEQRKTKRQLREVRHRLRKDIESLGNRLKFANIFLIPLIVLATATFMWAYRTMRKG